jgi:hypothetical protein
VADGSGGLRVIDVSNPSVPVKTGHYASPEASYSVTVVGTTAYLGGFNYLRIINVANPAAPVYKGRYQAFSSICLSR